MDLFYVVLGASIALGFVYIAITAYTGRTPKFTTLLFVGTFPFAYLFASSIGETLIANDAFLELGIGPPDNTVQKPDLACTPDMNCEEIEWEGNTGTIDPEFIKDSVKRQMDQETLPGGPDNVFSDEINTDILDTGDLFE